MHDAHARGFAIFTATAWRVLRSVADQTSPIAPLPMRSWSS